MFRINFVLDKATKVKRKEQLNKTNSLKNEDHTKIKVIQSRFVLHLKVLSEKVLLELSRVSKFWGHSNLLSQCFEFHHQAMVIQRLGHGHNQSNQSTSKGHK